MDRHKSSSDIAEAMRNIAYGHRDSRLAIAREISKLFESNQPDALQNGLERCRDLLQMGDIFLVKKLLANHLENHSSDTPHILDFSRNIGSIDDYAGIHLLGEFSSDRQDIESILSGVFIDDDRASEHYIFADAWNSAWKIASRIGDPDLLKHLQETVAGAASSLEIIINNIPSAEPKWSSFPSQVSERLEVIYTASLFKEGSLNDMKKQLDELFQETCDEPFAPFLRWTVRDTLGKRVKQLQRWTGPIQLNLF